MCSFCKKICRLFFFLVFLVPFSVVLLRAMVIFWATMPLPLITLFDFKYDYSSTRNDTTVATAARFRIPKAKPIQTPVALTVVHRLPVVTFQPAPAKDIQSKRCFQSRCISKEASIQKHRRVKNQSWAARPKSLLVVPTHCLREHKHKRCGSSNTRSCRRKCNTTTYRRP